MLPQLLGVLLLTGTAGFVIVALGMALWARSRDKPLLARRAVIAGSAMVGVVTGDGGLDYLVPGWGNPLVQRQRRLALPSPAGA